MIPESLGKLHKPELNAPILAQAEQIRQQNTALTARVAALEVRLNIPPKTPDNYSRYACERNSKRVYRFCSITRGYCPNNYTDFARTSLDFEINAAQVSTANRTKRR